MTSDSRVFSLSDQTWERLVLSDLHNADFRLTVPRRRIVGWIAARRTPFTAEELAIAVEDGRESVARATVYRTIEWLRGRNWLVRVQHDGSENTYTRVLPGHHHTAVCTACGQTLVLEGCTALDPLTRTLATQGFYVQGHVLEVFGLCAECGGASYL
jgi:Fe2+ or Zn2+ uptake regulation protein